MIDMRFSLLLFSVVLIFMAPVAKGQSPVNTITIPLERPPHNNITGILGAFGEEITLLLQQVQQKKETVIAHITFTEGLLNGRKVVIAQTGIGKVNAAITTTLLLEHFQPSEIVFTGIAGAVDTSLSPGDLVIGTKVAYHDYGTLLNDGMLQRPTRNPFTMQENPVYFPCDSGLVQLAKTAVGKTIFTKIKRSQGEVYPKIITGIIVTGDVFVSSLAATQHLQQQMHAEATEMEGAAVAQVCWQQQYPFIIIRSMSDNANSNASLDVKTFYQVAARNSATLVIAIAGMIGKKK